MNALNSDCLLTIFDYFKDQQDSLLALGQVSPVWNELLRRYPSRYFKKVTVDQNNYTQIPLEHVESAVVRRGTPRRIAKSIIYRFTKTLRHLETNKLTPTEGIVRHLRTIGLRSLHLKGNKKQVLKWERFWSGNENLVRLVVENKNYLFLPRLPKNLKSCNAETIDPNCLKPCSSLRSLCVVGSKAFDLHFPGLKSLDLYSPCSALPSSVSPTLRNLTIVSSDSDKPRNFEIFLKNHRLSLRRVDVSFLSWQNLDRVEFPHLEHLETHFVSRSAAHRNNFPKLKTLILNSYSDSEEIELVFPTEATDLESLTLLRLKDDDELKGLNGHLGKLSRLKSLNVSHHSRIQNLLDSVADGLSILKVELSGNSVIDLKRFTRLSQLSITRRESESDDEPTVAFPSRVERVAIDCRFDYARAPTRVEELFVDSEDFSCDFLEHCLSFGLRILHLRFLVFDSKLEARLLERVFDERQPSLYAVYVSAKFGNFARLENAIRKRCPNLGVFLNE